MKNSGKLRMAEYINNDFKVVSIGDDIGIDIPKPITSINFDAYHVGTYVVDVKHDGSYYATFVGKTYEVKKHDENNNCW